jgi:ElaB/YqjD/DUF883 family membrane-anchored ribosome-binding protein
MQMAGSSSTTPKTTKPRTAKKPATKKAAPKSNTEIAKSRFNAALDEAKAGAAALTAEARERGVSYKDQAQHKGEDYYEQAKTKAGELARDGKARTSDALSSLGKAVGDNAETLDEKFGVKYGDYARSASRNLQETASKLDSKSVEELGEDAREMVRRNPGKSVGIAVLAGFFLSRLFRGK